MYQENIANIEKEDLFKIPVGLLRSDDGMLFFYSERELHEILAREICTALNKGFIKLSNYGEGSHFRCVTVCKAMMNQKSVKEWFKIITSSLNLRPDVYWCLTSHVFSCDAFSYNRLFDYNIIIFSSYSGFITHCYLSIKNCFCNFILNHILYSST